jgi:3-(3-hydroxy-phenyl)propionate hydroxylase
LRAVDVALASDHEKGAHIHPPLGGQGLLRRPDDRTPVLGEFVAEMLALDEPRKRLGAMIAGLDIRYDLGAGHPLLGRRMPDLDIVTADGPTRVYALLHEARPVLLNFAATFADDRVKGIEAASGGVCELPGVGQVPLPPAVLVRPDGHVAWTGDGGAEGLRAACAVWLAPDRCNARPTRGRPHHAGERPCHKWCAAAPAGGAGTIAVRARR